MILSIASVHHKTRTVCNQLLFYGNIPIYFNLGFNDPKKNSFNVHQNALNASNLSVIITTPYVWVMIEILFNANNWLPFKMSIKTEKHFNIV